MRITLTGKFKHADLYEAAKKLGSQSAVDEIALFFGVNQQRIRHIESRAIRRLRARMEILQPSDFEDGEDEDIHEIQKPRRW